MMRAMMHGVLPTPFFTLRKETEMVVRIRITAAPPSNVAPDEVCEALVGVEMTAMPDDGNDGDA